MRIKTYLQGKAIIIAVIICVVIMFSVIIADILIILIGDLHGDNKTTLIISLLLGNAVVIIYFICLNYMGILIPTYITDEGVSCKNKLLRWDEIKITVFTLKEPRARYYLLFDREYQYGKQNLINKMRNGFCAAIDSPELYNSIPMILDKIKSNVVFLNTDGNVVADISELPPYVSDVFANQIEIAKNTVHKSD